MTNLKKYGFFATTEDGSLFTGIDLLEEFTEDDSGERQWNRGRIRELIKRRNASRKDSVVVLLYKQ